VDTAGHEIAGQMDMTGRYTSGGVARLHDAGKDAGAGTKLGGVVGGGAACWQDSVCWPSRELARL
jgi:hypothetical protein